jgi:hypothetical protein
MSIEDEENFKSVETIQTPTEKFSDKKFHTAKKEEFDD